MNQIPNLISIARILFGLLGGFLLWSSAQSASEDASRLYAGASGILFLAGAVSDWLDGYLARRLGSESQFGALIDPIADKVLTGSYLAVFVLISQFDPWLTAPVLIILGRDILVTAIRLSGPQTHKLAVSIEAKLKTAFLMGLILAPFVFVSLGLQDLTSYYFYWVGGVWFIAILSGWTAHRYFR
jgi:CDP-diacylglycerol--glycerol-3-phosphate 3-phosphatidyltransferase